MHGERELFTAGSEWVGVAHCGQLIEGKDVRDLIPVQDQES